MTDKKPVGLYIHIPFCNSKCPYCDFYSFPAKEEIKTAYIESLKQHILKTDMLLDTVYFGGGTPSSIGSAAISDILKCVNFTADAEITVECNPSDTGCENSSFSFDEVADAGVNRISMGLQSAIDSERKILGRKSGCREVSTAIERCRKAGITNISLDLMMGVPGQTAESLERSLDYCVSSGATHISSYILKIEEGTFFYKNSSRYIFPDDDTVGDMYISAAEFLISHGFSQYEISNFSLPGYESRHNLKYWHDEEYLGVGPAAHSFINGKRFYYPGDIKEFMNNCPTVDDGSGGDEEEYVMLALRLAEGLDFDKFTHKYGHSVSDKFIEYASFLSAKGLAELTDKKISLTTRGFVISNSIICRLTEQL